MKPHNSLVFYKRHTPGCPLSADKYNFGCSCIIWVSGRTPLGHPVTRRSTGHTEKTLAEQFGAELTAKTAPEHAKPTIHGITLPDAMRAFLTARSPLMSDDVHDTYVTLLNSFQTYCAAHHIWYMPQITVDTVLNFRDLPAHSHLAGGSKDQMIKKFRCFFRHSYKRGWIPTPVGDNIEHTKSASEPTAPFTDREIEALMRGAEESARLGGYKSPHTFRLLLELMLQTGMRVTDATLFMPGFAYRGEHCWHYLFTPVKQQKVKLKQKVTVYLSDTLMAEILACETATPERPLFPPRLRAYKARASRNNRPTRRPKPFKPRNTVRDLMIAIGKRVGIEDCRPHRLRDTFAVRELRKGATLDEVSALLGHSSVTITQKHYAAWTPERRNLLESRFASRLGGSLAPLRQIAQNGGF